MTAPVISAGDLVERKADYKPLKRLIADTFPDIHWEVYNWHKYTGRPDVWEEGKTIRIHGGFVDGWAYKLPAFQAPEGSEQSVVDALYVQIETWWRERNPGFVMRVYLAVQSALARSSLNQDGGKP